MNIGLFEDFRYVQLLPLVWLRAAFELRCGRERLIDKVARHMGPRIVRFWVRDVLREALAERFDLAETNPDEDWWLLNARVLVTADVVGPPPGYAWEANGTLVAVGLTHDRIGEVSPELFLDGARLREWVSGFRCEPPPSCVRLIEHPWDLVLANPDELARECNRGGVQEGEIHPGAHLLNPGNIHVARGARVKPGVVLDAEEGPIHIDRNAHIQANAVLIGPCYVGWDSVVRPGTRVREGTTIGPVCKVGGEIEASIFQGFSNKQHDGFLGHSFVGEWVNLGADTVTSDLKNTYGTIRVSINGVGVETGQHFVGSFIGDHSKTGIGTILPTGCVIGVASNIFTQSTVPKFVPSFAWLTDEGLTKYRLDKAIHIARIVMARRDRHLSEADERLLAFVSQTAPEVEAAGWQ